MSSTETDKKIRQTLQAESTRVCIEKGFAGKHEQGNQVYRVWRGKWMALHKAGNPAMQQSA